MKANYKVINNKQVQLRKVIEGFKPDDVASLPLQCHAGINQPQ